MSFIKAARKFLVISMTLILSLGSAQTSVASAKSGAPCKKIGDIEIVSSKRFTCIRSGKKVVWNKGVAIAKAPAVAPAKSAPSSEYETTKLKAYKNIRAELEKNGAKNVELVYHTTANFPEQLKKLYIHQSEVTSALAGTFFKKKEVVNIYLYTEKDLDYLKTASVPNVNNIISDMKSFFDAWKKGQMTEHNLGGPAWYMEYQGKVEGHAGLFVHSKSTPTSLRAYAVQVLPHEYFHVVQDYFVKTLKADWGDQQSWDLLFPPIFREGSANTISFALATESQKDYLQLYKTFISEKKNQSGIKIFQELTSKSKVVEVLKKIRTRASDPDAHESSYSIGSLVFEWVIAEYGFDGYRKIIENQMSYKNFNDNLVASIGISENELYEKAANHVLQAFQ